MISRSLLVDQLCIVQTVSFEMGEINIIRLERKPQKNAP